MCYMTVNIIELSLPNAKSRGGGNRICKGPEAGKRWVALEIMKVFVLEWNEKYRE